MGLSTSMPGETDILVDIAGSSQKTTPYYISKTTSCSFKTSEVNSYKTKKLNLWLKNKELVLLLAIRQKKQ